MEIENRSFVLDEVPRSWHGGRRAVSAFFDNLSIFFPAGERFFIASVAAHRAHVKDPALAAEIRDFTIHEANHTREHQRFNQHQRGHHGAGGRPIDEMEARVEKILRRVSRRAPRRWQLAATCALEHFTALMARGLLEDPRALEGAHPEMAALWRWHAREERAHRSVAFDVYLAAGGNVFERDCVMVAATVIFWGKVLEQQLRLMHADGILGSPREWLQLVNFLFVSPGALRRLVVPYLGYYRRGFHP